MGVERREGRAEVIHRRILRERHRGPVVRRPRRDSGRTVPHRGSPIVQGSASNASMMAIASSLSPSVRVTVTTYSFPFADT